jgi:hypothetical protein
MSIKIKLNSRTEIYYVKIENEFDEGTYRIEMISYGPHDFRYKVENIKNGEFLNERSRPYNTITKAIEKLWKDKHIQKIKTQAYFLARTSEKLIKPRIKENRKRLLHMHKKGK